MTTLTTNDTTPVIEGTATVGTGETLTVEVSGATYEVAVSGGTWSLDLGTATPTSGTLTALTDGSSYNVIATVTDAAGNATSETTSNELVIDTTGPSAPTVTTLTTTDTTPTVQGTFDKDDGTVTQVVVNGETYLASGSDLTVDAVNGTWSLTIPAGNELTDATYEVAVTAEDALGNATTDTTSNELVIDTTGPIIISGDTVVLIGTGEKKQGNDDKNDDGVPDGLFFDIDTTGNEFNDGKDQDDDNVLEVEDLGKDDFSFSTSETLYWTGDADDDGDIETLQVKWDDDDDGKLQGYVEYQDDKGKDKTTDVIKLEMKGSADTDDDGVKDGFYWKAETKGDGVFSRTPESTPDSIDLVLDFQGGCALQQWKRRHYV